MAGKRRAEADEVAAAQLVERAQQIVLICQPAFMLRDDCGPIAVRADPERIAPFAAAADIGVTCRFVQNCTLRSFDQNGPSWN